MSNIMDLKSVKNSPRRSGFDLSNRNCFTAKVGQLLPVWWSEVLPGDKFKIDISQFMRTAPIQTASFGRVRQYYDFYFVPYKLLWDKFPAWVVQTENPYHASSLKDGADVYGHHPYMMASDVVNYLKKIQENNIFDDSGCLSYYSSSRLLSYLGYDNLLNVYRNLDQDVALNPFPLLTYQKIYQDHKRYGQWEKAAPWSYNLDWINKDSQTRLDFSNLGDDMQTKDLFTLQYCNFDKDLITGVLPSPQFGDAAIVGPISGDFSAYASLHTVDGLPAGDDPKILTAIKVGGAVRSLGDLNPNGTGQSSGIAVGTAMSVDQMQGSTLGISVAMLRMSEALQKWKEICLSGSPDLREQIYKHWGVQMSPSESYLSQYLGGIACDVDISEVVNSNITDENSADIAGKGISASNGHIEFNNPNNDYGIIMCIYHAKPIIEYFQRYFSPRALTKTQPTDYAMPEFDSVGMQQVLFYECAKPGAMSNPFNVWGYAPRYYEYKTAVDRVNGAFQSTLQPWVIPYFFQSGGAGKVSYLFFKVPQFVMDNMFKIAADSTLETDHFYNIVYFDVKAVRNLSRDGLPY